MRSQRPVFDLEPEVVEPPTCDRLWTTEECAEFLGVTPQTLHQWRYVGKCPPAFRVGKYLRFDPDKVRQWLVDECLEAA
ncbi:MAG: helix-turn-helix transcriptional regulator [Oryzihumus sp.]